MDQRDKDYARELVKLKKQRAAQTEPETRATYIPQKPEIPKGFINKIKHFWFYYKFHFLGVVLALVCTAVCVGSCINKEKEDLTVLFLAGRSYLPEELAIMEESLEKYCPDFNNDSNVHIALIDVYIDENNPQYNYAMQQKLVAEVAAGNGVIYLADQKGLERFNEIKALVDLSDIAQNTVNNNTSVIVPSSVFFGEAAAKQDFYISLRYFEKADLEKTDKKATRIANSIEVFKNIINNNIIEENENGSN
ncbi:MAG: hypothetical protein E7480_06455 [Ruminococcaceae bacterium]|nr:hypothetical protein [Oscillospiraceae bacterium]